MFGWLTPKGNFIECSLYEHLAVIMKNDEARRVDKLAVLQSGLESVEEGCLELIARDEHPEWHCYEMACDDARYEVWKILMNEGFIRLGQNGDRIHFEGRPNILKNRMQACKDFAENRNCTAEFEPQRNEPGSRVLGT